MPGPERMTRALVVVQVAAVVVLGLVTVARFHVWADIDERPHYDFVQALAERHELPRPTDLVSPEVQAITDRTSPRPSPTDRATIGLAGRSYEAIQPPLYYVAAVPSFLVLGDHRQKVFAVRAFDLLLLLAAVALLWRLACALARPREAELAFAVALPVVLWPGFLTRAITLGNDPLELVLTFAVLLALWRAERGGGIRALLLAGLGVGLALLTQLALLFLVPLFGVVVARRLRAARGARERLAAAAAGGLPAVLLAPWLALNLVRYGSLTVDIAGQRQTVGALTGASSVGDRLADLPRLNARLLDGVLPQEWVVQLQLTWVRAAVDGLALALLAGGLVLLAVRRRDARTWFLAAPALTAWLLMNATYVVTANDTFLLRYAYPALAPLALALGLALAGAGATVRRAAPAVAIVASLAVAALWVDVAGAFYFTNVGDALGI